jgi:hypothetical protein
MPESEESMAALLAALLGATTVMVTVPTAGAQALQPTTTVNASVPANPVVGV